MNNKRTDTKKKVTVHLDKVDTCKDCKLLGYLKLNSTTISKNKQFAMCAFIGGTPPKDGKPFWKCLKHFDEDVEILQVILDICNVNLNQGELFND